MFQVLDNGVPADCDHKLVDQSWDKSTFDTFQEAHDYANRWLGAFGGVELKLNTPYDYSGYGDIIEIVEIYTKLNTIVQG